MSIQAFQYLNLSHLTLSVEKMNGNFTSEPGPPKVTSPTS